MLGVSQKHISGGAMSQVYCIRRRRKGKHLTYTDRQELENLVKQNEKASKNKKKTQRELAFIMGISPATISRELKRGLVTLRDSQWCDYDSYSADVAQDDYDKKATHKGPGLKIGKDHALAKHIEQKILKDKYSPDAVIMEISTGKYQFDTTISTRTLYNYIENGVFLNLTNKDLPRQGKTQKRRYRRVRKAQRNVGGKSIIQRPKEADNRLEYGHWEMDCIESGKHKGRSCLLVMVERMTRETIIFKLLSQKQEEVQKRIDRLERSMGRKRFAKKFKSITVDNGSEFLNWPKLEKSCLAQHKKRTQIYYCHPYSSWERGSNEQINGHIRRFIPKGSDISKYTNKRIKEIERWLNSYPRRILDGMSAKDAIKQLELTA
jgi:IS30 family transposase